MQHQQVVRGIVGKVRIGALLALLTCLVGLNQARAQYEVKAPKMQRARGLNLPNYDNKLVHYGFFVALNYSSFRLNPSSRFLQGIRDYDNGVGPKNPLYAMNPVGNYSFTTGFILNLRVAEHFDLRFLPTVAFYQRFIDFRYRNDSTSTQLNQSTFSFLEFPLLLKFKSQRRNNTRMYLVAGIKPAIEVGAKRDEIDGRSFLRVNTSDFSVDYGFGLDLYYPLFKFSPEIRFSHGFTNMKYPDVNPFAQSLIGFTTHTVTIYFHFE